jgi:YcaO-like protein with predicted kinase domain
MPALGITRVANVTGLDRIGIPVVMVCRPNSRSLAVAQGKGITLALAKAAGLMESFESFHAEHIIKPLKLAAYKELDSIHPVADVAKLPRTTSTVFHPDLPILWIEGQNLLGGDPAWVPYELVHLNYTTPRPTGSGCFAASSSGLASGNHLLEAISHGICELVERDALTLWYLKSEAERQRTRLALESVDDPDCRAVLQRCEQADIEIAAWDITTEVGIPAFLCTIAERYDVRWRAIPPSGGSGCHPSRDIALLRALTEAAQSRLVYISGSRDDAIRSRYEECADPVNLQAHHDLVATTGHRRPIQKTPTWDGDTFDEDLDWELRNLIAAGVREVIVVDLTRPEFRIPVVRVIIPGLEASIRIPDYALGSRAQSKLPDR